MKHLKLFESFDQPVNTLPKVETPPKWVKNPRNWAMDKIVELLTPETNITLIANIYVESDIFKFTDIKNLESDIKSIYQSCKAKRELDVMDHVKRFANNWYRKTNKNDLIDIKEKYTLVYKFENLLNYFY